LYSIFFANCRGRTPRTPPLNPPLSMHLENNSNILFHSFCSIREVTQKWMVTIFVYGVGPIFRRHNRPKLQIVLSVWLIQETSISNKTHFYTNFLNRKMEYLNSISTKFFNKQIIQTVSRYWNKTNVLFWCMIIFFVISTIFSLFWKIIM
jgi:hypothetical protein